MTSRALRRTATTGLALVVLLGVAGCAVPPPSGPTFLALPSKGKSYAQFTSEDQYCRGQALAQNGGVTPGNAAATSGLASAGLGTLVGAAGGALIGAAFGSPAAGAAVGGGTGLLFGATSGAGAAEVSAAGLQQRYDGTYAQCMVAYGNLIPQPGGAVPYAYRPPVVVGPTVGFGVGYGGYGW